MEKIWSKELLGEKNISLAFVYKAESKKELSLRLAASNEYQVFCNGNFTAYGPMRSAHRYSHVRTYKLSPDECGRVCAAVIVCGAQINSFDRVNEPPFFAAELLSDDKIIARSSDFKAYRLADRLQKVQRYSFQRTFTESYKLTEDREALLKGNECGLPAVCTEQTEGNTLLSDGGLSEPDYHFVCGVPVESGNAFTDPEQRYRQRYLDLIVNPQVKEVFVKRTRMINAIRNFFNSKGYLEVETPVLQAIPGGASARPFITHHNALDIPLYLRIANELYLKRLIVGGFEGVYEFSRNFRNEGMDRTHNPEFTCMEIYVAYKDYLWMMNFTEEMIETAALAINGTTKAVIGENEIDFKRPFRRVRMADAIKEYTGYDIEKMSEEELYEACVKMEIPVDKTMGKGKLIDEIFGEKCEGHYIQPTFIYDYPKEMSPLTKKHRENPELTERFELFVNGKEVANAYSELNDPIDQLERFQDQLKLQERGDDEAMYIDYDFVRALEYGMPPTSGMGIGIDRLCMFLTNSASIQDVLFFPQMKPEKKVTVDGDEKYEALGIPKEWIAVVKKAGYQTVEALKAVGNTNKLHQELCGINKKEKLGLSGLTPEEVKKWLA